MLRPLLLLLERLQQLRKVPLVRRDSLHGAGELQEDVTAWFGSSWVCAYVNACTNALDGGGTGRCSTAGSRSRSALRKAVRSFSVAAVFSINRTWNSTCASDSSHA